MVFFGAVWSVYDTATIPWIADEIGYARSLISLGVPVLGICFGGQMLAAAVGGTVSRAPIPEIGWVSRGRRTSPRSSTPGRGCSGTSTGSRCPREVPVLARTAAANQAFVSGRALGVQFHPEVNEAVLEAWLRRRTTPAQLAEAGIDPQRADRAGADPGGRRGGAGARPGPPVRARRRAAAGGAAAGWQPWPTAAVPALRPFSHPAGDGGGRPAGLAWKCVPRSAAGPRHLRGRPRGGHDQHRRRLGDADHLPHPAGVRVPAGARERVEQRRAGARRGLRGARVPGRARRAAAAAAPARVRLAVRRAGRRDPAARAARRGVQGDRAGADRDRPGHGGVPAPAGQVGGGQAARAAARPGDSDGGRAGGTAACRRRRAGRHRRVGVVAR